MTLTVQKLHAPFAGEASGVDIKRPFDQPTLDAVIAALDVHGVLVFRGSKISEDEQIVFATQFGTLEGQNGVITTGIKRRISERLVDISNVDENDALLGATSRRRMQALGNQLWHTDLSFKRVPAKYSLLHAHTVVSEGGETQFVDMRAAYELLSPRMQSKIASLVVEHSIFASRAIFGFTEFSDEERRALPPVHRPLVRVHPGSGRKTLYLASHASHIVGWPVPDGRMIIFDLMEHATQPQFVYTHKWRIGDLVIWDNRCTMHRGRAYDEQERRDMRRATIEDPDPAIHDRRIAS